MRIMKKLLVEKAIVNGYHKFICIGGDGTIHHMVNGIMKQNQNSTIKYNLLLFQ